MRKSNFLLLFLLLFSFCIYAQNPRDSLQLVVDSLSYRIDHNNKEIRSIKSANYRLKRELKENAVNFSSVTQELKKRVNDVDQMARNNKNEIESNTADLGTKIINSEKATSNKILSLSQRLGKNTLYWIIAVLTATAITLLLFIFLRRKVSKGNIDLHTQISNTKEVLEEEAIKLDSKFVDILDKQLKLINENADKESKPDQSEEIDHSLALKVADEVIRIEKNLTRMDNTVKGFKQLSASVERIKDNFMANGYELVEMLGKPFDLGMKAIANFRPDESLGPEEKVITRIIKPQVNHKGVMIQAAQIEVSQGE